jgi:large subunit ribosomal protein L24
MADARGKRRRHALKVRSGDQVRVISGKDRGKSGRVLRVEPAKDRLYVEGLNLVKRHMRPQAVRETRRGQEVGGVIEREGPIHVSNVMLLDPKGQPTRVGLEREDGRRYRVAKTTKARID